MCKGSFMFLDEPDDGRQRGSDFRIKLGHRHAISAAVSVLPVRRELVWLCAVFSGVVAVLIGWALAEPANRLFHRDGRVQIEKADQPNLPARPPGELLLDLRDKTEARNTALAMGILGAALGMALGVAGGLSRKSPRAAAVCGMTGFLLGAAVGAAVPWHLLPLLYRSSLRPPHPAFPALVHTAMYAAIGGVAGLAFGGGLCGLRGAAKGLPAGTWERFLER